MVNVRILLADGHPVIRDRFRAVLEQQADWEVVAEAADGLDAVRLAVGLEPDVAVIGVTLPSINGIDATRQIMRHSRATRILVTGFHTDEAYLTNALRAGAAGYLLKSDADVQLVEAVESIAAGRAFISPAIACGTGRASSNEPRTV